MCSYSPGPSSLKNMLGECAYIHEIPTGEWRGKDCGVATPRLGGGFSLSLPGQQTCLMTKMQLKKIKSKCTAVK